MPGSLCAAASLTIIRMKLKIGCRRPLGEPERRIFWGNPAPTLTMRTGGARLARLTLFSVTYGHCQRSLKFVVKSPL